MKYHTINVSPDPCLMACPQCPCTILYTIFLFHPHRICYHAIESWKWNPSSPNSMPTCSIPGTILKRRKLNLKGAVTCTCDSIWKVRTRPRCPRAAYPHCHNKLWKQSSLHCTTISNKWLLHQVINSSNNWYVVQLCFLWVFFRTDSLNINFSCINL